MAVLNIVRERQMQMNSLTFELISRRKISTMFALVPISSSSSKLFIFSFRFSMFVLSVLYRFGLLGKHTSKKLCFNSEDWIFIAKLNFDETSRIYSDHDI